MTGVIAWAVGRGWSEVWHRTWSETDMVTVCRTPVPPGRISRERHGNAPTCKKCDREYVRTAHLKSRIA